MFWLLFSLLSPVASRWISDIRLAHGSFFDDADCPDGYEKHPQDINDGARGFYTHFCVLYTYERSQAMTDIWLDTNNCGVDSLENVNRGVEDATPDCFRTHKTSNNPHARLVNVWLEYDGSSSRPDSPSSEHWITYNPKRDLNPEGNKRIYLWKTQESGWDIFTNRWDTNTCPEGHIAHDYGFRTACDPCYAGKYAVGSHALQQGSCEPCPEGQYSGDFWDTCIPPGLWSDFFVTQIRLREI
eukprot:GABV01001574.1.p1 GENE.GABV01001574.1~~GABV01001574.1.p1  ORF type:complete len:242 (-),score=50.42 GABV01001574.1:31-756(-)